MSWKILATIAVTFLSLFHLGLASKPSIATPRFNKIDVQSQTDEESVTVTQTLGPAGGSIIVDFMGQPREVNFVPGALRYNVAIKVTVTNQVDKTYHDRDRLEKFYPIEYLDYVSPRIIVELPLDALDWQSSEHVKGLIGVHPKYFDPNFDNQRFVSAEVRVLTAEGYDIFDSVSYYSPGHAAGIYATDLKIDFKDNPPEILKLSVQIVDRRKAWFENSIENLNRINSLATPSAKAINFEGVFKLYNNY